MSKDNKKPFYKKWWFILIAVLLVIGVIGSLGDKDKPSTDAGTTTSATEKAEESKIVIDTTALGEYGKELTYKGIDYNNNSAAVELKENGYFIPGGKYKVALTDGNKSVSLSVFSGKYNEQKDNDGNIYEENADLTGCVVLFNGEEAKDIEIPEGYCVKTSDNANCILEFTAVK